jgi:hypothetical protein
VIHGAVASVWGAGLVVLAVVVAVLADSVGLRQQARISRLDRAGAILMIMAFALIGARFLVMA